MRKELSDYEMWKRFSRAARQVSDPEMRTAIPMAYAVAMLMYHNFPQSHMFVRWSLGLVGDEKTRRELDDMALYAMGLRRSWK